MKYIKKVVSIILLICIFVSGAATAASPPDVTDNYLLKVLRVLDCFDILYDMESGGNFRPDDPVTRGEAVAEILKLIAVGPADTISKQDEVFADVSQEDEYYTEIYTAYREGFIVGYGREFEPETNITYAELVKMLCTYLGYDILAESRGGYPGGYLSAAADIKLNKNISDTSGEISRKDFATVLYNALTAPVMTMSVSGGNISASSDEEHTILSDNHRMVSGEGLVEANSYTSLYTIGGIGINSVEIGGIIFDEGDTGAGSLIGRYVEYYAKEVENNEYEIVGIWADEERFVELDATYIVEEETDFDYVSYLEDDQSRVEKYRLEPNADMIYNGQAVLFDDISWITPGLGKVVLSDTDKDGSYDVVIVNAYEVFIADNVIADEETIVFKDNKGSMTFEDNFRETKIIRDGAPAGITEIAEWDVVQVAMPPQPEDGMLEIIVTSEKASGIVKTFNSESIMIDSSEYKFSESYQPVRLSQVKAGGSVTALLDFSGRVVDVQTVIGSEICGFLYKAVFAEEDEKAYFTIFNENGEWIQLTAGEKIRFNDDSTKASEVVEFLQCTGDASGIRVNAGGFLVDIWNRLVKNVNGVFEVITDGNGVRGAEPFQKITDRQMVMYSVDKNGLLRSLKTADYENKGHAFVTLGDYSAEPGIQYRDGQKAFYIYRWGGNPYPSFYADEDTKVFQIPFDRPDRKDLYTIAVADTSFLGSQDINCYAKTYGFADTKGVDGVPYMMMQAGGTTSTRKSFIVTEVYQTIDEDDMPVLMVSGLSEGLEVQYMVEDTEILKKPSGKYLRSGDVVTYDLNADGSLKSMWLYGDTNQSGIVFDMDVGLDEQLGHLGGYRSPSVARGYVISVNYDKMRVEINNGETSEDGKNPVFGMWRTWTTSEVYITDFRTGKTEIGTIDDISVNDYIAVIFDGALEAIYVYKNR